MVQCVYTHTHTHTHTEGAANRGRHSHDNGPHVSTSGDRVTATSYGPPPQNHRHQVSADCTLKFLHNFDKMFSVCAEKGHGILCRVGRVLWWHLLSPPGRWEGNKKRVGTTPHPPGPRRPPPAPGGHHLQPGQWQHTKRQFQVQTQRQPKAETSSISQIFVLPPPSPHPHPLVTRLGLSVKSRSGRGQS